DLLRAGELVANDLPHGALFGSRAEADAALGALLAAALGETVSRGRRARRSCLASCRSLSNSAKRRTFAARPNTSRLDHVGAGRPRPLAGIARINDQLRGGDQHPIINCIVVRRNQNGIIGLNRRWIERDRSASGKRKVLARAWHLGHIGI